MPTARLVASAYGTSSSSVTVSNPDRMYTDVDGTTYATLTSTSRNTTAYYVYIRGFNLTSLPSGAVVSSFTVKVRGYESNLSTSSSYAPRLHNGSADISGTTASSSFGTSTSTITVPTGSLTWSDIVSYGSDFGISVCVRRSSKNTQGYLYIYGAEIDVTYTVPVNHTVTSSTSAGTINPSGATTVQEGASYSLTISGVSSPTVTDNGVDVTSQLTQTSSGSGTLIPDDYSNTGFSLTDISNAYADTSSSTYALLDLGGSSNGTIYFDLGGLTIPTGATINSVSCSAALGYDSGGSGSGFSASCQMYTGSNARGSSTTVVTEAHNNMSKTLFNLSIGSWTASEIANARFMLTATNSASSTHRLMHVYGVSFSVSFTIAGVVYVYTIASVTADHTIVVTGGAAAPVITIGTPTRTIISDESGYDQSVCTFTSDLALQQWEARATKAGTTPARGVGLLVESGTTLAAGATGTVTVDDEELTNGDGEYTITVYGQSTSGIWSE